ncbi:MAG: hypothetical protein LC685_01480 [Actinobacteria bacterium]|nr:hypothetical protein [Actinomycetota bacterium]
MSATASNGAGSLADAGNAAVQTVIDAIEHPPVTPAPDANVTAAFALGWQMGELYRPDPTHPLEPVTPDDLPTLGELTLADHAKISLEQINAALAKLGPAFKAAAIPPLAATDVDAAFPDTLDEAARQLAVCKLHVKLLTMLTAADFRLGKAYGLGQALADACRQPVTWADVRDEFRADRVEQICTRIDDLASAFPAHAGHSVSASIRRWGQFVQMDAPGPKAEAALDGLNRQGQLWRSLLSGEKSGPDMLKASNYLDAAAKLVETTRGLARRFLHHFRLVLALIAGLFLGGIALMLSVDSSASIVAGASGILASIGLSWKTVGATIGGLGVRLEQHVWEAELDIAITEAITILPSGGAPPAVAEPLATARVARTLGAPATDAASPAAGAAASPAAGAPAAPDGGPAAAPPATAPAAR